MDGKVNTATTRRRKPRQYSLSWYETPAAPSLPPCLTHKTTRNTKPTKQSTARGQDRSEQERWRTKRRKTLPHLGGQIWYLAYGKTQNGKTESKTQQDGSEDVRGKRATTSWEKKKKKKKRRKRNKNPKRPFSLAKSPKNTKFSSVSSAPPLPIARAMSVPPPSASLCRVTGWVSCNFQSSLNVTVSISSPPPPPPHRSLTRQHFPLLRTRPNQNRMSASKSPSN